MQRPAAAAPGRDAAEPELAVAEAVRPAPALSAPVRAKRVPKSMKRKIRLPARSGKRPKIVDRDRDAGE
eukprot:3516373-Heterocapsa_arctica.AAC.1